MANETTSDKLIIPEIWQDVIQAQFKGAVRFVSLAKQFDTLTDSAVAGDTIHFPRFNALTDAEDVNETDDLPIEAGGQTDATAKVREAGKGFALTDRTLLNTLGDPQAEYQRQLGGLAARRIDLALIEEAAAETEADTGKKIREQKPYKVNLPKAQTAFGWGHIVDMMAKFGDEWDPANAAGLAIRSEQSAQLMKSKEFISAADLGTATPLLTGQIGQIGSIPVVVTDRLPANKAFLIMRNALGVIWKRRPLVETDRDIIGRKTVITFNMHYAVKRLNDKGVVVATLEA